MRARLRSSGPARGQSNHVAIGIKLKLAVRAAGFRSLGIHYILNCRLFEIQLQNPANELLKTTIGSFTVGIFGPFFIHFPFHFVSIFS